MKDSISLQLNRAVETMFYLNGYFECPLCGERTGGAGHLYKELRICDDCYCDITGMQKVNYHTVMRT